uniref:EF-hand domain-containing protein n=1 Tax=Haptolina ericina TaxID=156174 RepID=A0A7S3EUQ6_9EUKA
MTGATRGTFTRPTSAPAIDSPRFFSRARPTSAPFESARTKAKRPVKHWTLGCQSPTPRPRQLEPLKTPRPQIPSKASTLLSDVKHPASRFAAMRDAAGNNKENTHVLEWGQLIDSVRPNCGVAPSGVVYSKLLPALSTAASAGSLAHAVDAAISMSYQQPTRQIFREPISQQLESMEQEIQRAHYFRIDHVQGLKRLLRQHKAKLQARFVAWDENGDGHISKAELAHAVRALGLNVADKDIDDFFAEYDPDASGTLDLKEFYTAAYTSKSASRQVESRTGGRNLKVVGLSALV